VASLHFLGTKFKVLRPLHDQMLLRLTFLALQSQDNLLGSFGLLVEDGLRLTTKSHLLRIVPALSLGEVGGLACLVLSDLVVLVLSALASSTVSLAFFRDVDHGE